MLDTSTVRVSRAHVQLYPEGTFVVTATHLSSFFCSFIAEKASYWLTKSFFATQLVTFCNVVIMWFRSEFVVNGQGHTWPLTLHFDVLKLVPGRWPWMIPCYLPIVTKLALYAFFEFLRPNMWFVPHLDLFIPIIPWPFLTSFRATAGLVSSDFPWWGWRSGVL